MRVTIYQPRYFPQLHYFNRMVSADIFVFLDNAQYTKSLRQKTTDGEKRITSFQSDTPIKLPHGKYLLTVPIRHDGYSPLHKTKIDYFQPWFARHLAIVRSSYQKSMSFSWVHDEVKALLSLQYISLATLNIMTTLWALAYLYDFPRDISSLSLARINTYLAKQRSIRLKKILLGSEIPIERPEGLQKGTEWTTALCLYLGASEYMYGATAKENYMNFAYYTSHGITPIKQEWTCNTYTQQFSRSLPFLPNLSIIDLLYNVSREEAQRMIA